MNKHCPVFWSGVFLLLAATVAAQPAAITRFPADQATKVNPDTHLVLTFSSTPTLGKTGQIRIYDASNNKLVDTLDLSIPPGPAGGGARGGAAAGRGATAGGGATATGGAATPAPATSAPAAAANGGRGAPAGGGGRGAATYSPVPYEYASGHFTNANTVPGTPSGVAVATPRDFQLTIIGGFTDGFHFYPVIIHDNVATIYPHNNLLDYNKTYYVQIDPGVLTVSDGSFTGISGNKGWTFTTKKTSPLADAPRLVVAGDGSGDFNTVQGAVDFIPDKNPKRVTIFIRNGMYEEIVYFRNKTNITFLGEDRDKVAVFYANNEVFNPHPSNVSTNEWPGTFPSRRAAFMADNSSGIQLVNFSVKTTATGQAEGLLLVGGKNIVSHVNISGSGDALQINDSVYLTDSLIVGSGDTILGRGPSFFNRCELNSRGAFMWIRNTAANHGNVFLNCTFRALGTGTTEMARAPTNGGRNYPNAEVVVINSALAGISPAGWGALGGDTAAMHFWEYNSTNVSDGKPVDVSQRHAASKQLTMEKDAATIANYSNPAYVLGWTPAMAPLVLTQPVAMAATVGQTATFTAKIAAIPTATYQWFKNGTAINGATDATLNLSNLKASDAGRYTLTATNASGATTSSPAALTVR